MSFLAPQRYDRAQVTVGNYDTLYDALNPAGDIARQHFFEWFSGGTLDSLWTQHTDATASQGWDDSVNGGYKLTSGTTGSDKAAIWFNAIQQYNATGHTLIVVMKPNSTTTGFHQTWMTSRTSMVTVSKGWMIDQRPGNANYHLYNYDTGWSNTDTSVPKDTSYHKWKGTKDSTSIRIWNNDTLQAITTSQLTSDDLAPLCNCQYNTTQTSMNILYLECFNT